MSCDADDRDMQHRVDEARRIALKYPDRVPVIVQRDPRSKLTLIDKNKFLVPEDLSYAQFMFVIRKRIRLKQSESLFMLCNGQLPTSSSLMREVQKRYAAPDGFTYLTYTGENTFGVPI